MAADPSRVRFSIDDLDDLVRAEIEAIPGVRVWPAKEGSLRTTVVAPDNAAWLVEEIAARWSRNAISWRPPQSLPRNAAKAREWLQPWVPEFLTPYQREGVKRALAWPNESGVFVWSAGSGKTLGAIVLTLTEGPATTVVVTKASIRPTWMRQVGEYTRGVQCVTLEGERDCHIPELDPSRPAILVTGYDTLPAWIEEIERVKPARVVFDEGHRAKSHQRWDAAHSWGDENAKPTFSLKENQAAACYRLSRAARKRLETTATPVRDRVRDLWAQLDLVRPYGFGGFYQFAKRYCGAIENPFGGMDTRGSSNLGELKRRLSYLVHNVPHSVANRSLPPARRLVTYVPIAQQNRASGSIAAEMRAANKRGPHALVEMRLMEAASRKRKIIVDHVLDAIDGGLKTVVFTGRRIDVAVMAEEVKKKLGMRECPVWTATGSDSDKDREAIRADYMRAPGPAVLIATGESMGEGLDLQDTDLGIMAMLPYTPGQIVQYEGRWVRLGMKRPVLIRYFVAEGTIDEHVSSILLGKLPAIEKTIDLDEVRGLTNELTGDEDELIMSIASKVLAG